MRMSKVAMYILWALKIKCTGAILISTKPGKHKYIQRSLKTKVHYCILNRKSILVRQIVCLNTLWPNLLQKIRLKYFVTESLLYVNAYKVNWFHRMPYRYQYID